MIYFVILLYLVCGVVAVRWCIRCSDKRGVDSTFSQAGFSKFLEGAAFSPGVFLIVVPFSIVFWPLLCLLDLSEIPKKQRLKQKQLEADIAKKNAQDIALEDQKRHQLLVGEVCETLGVLSPMGQVQIEGRNWDAISSGGYIAAGQQVVVVGVRGGSLEVAQEDAV